MRLEETHTQNIPHFFEWLRRSKSQHWQRRTEPLVMASTIEGLPDLTGCIKSRDLVVAASFPRVDAEPCHPAFLPRPLPQLEPLPAPKAITAAATATDGIERTRKPPRQRDLDRGESKGFEIFD